MIRRSGSIERNDRHDVDGIEPRPGSTVWQFRLPPIAKKYGIGYAFAVPLAIVVGLVVVFPIAYMALQTLGHGDWKNAFGRIFVDEFARSIVYRTVRVGVFATALSLVLSFGVALWMRELKARWRGVVVILLISPLLVSVIVRTLGWVVILGPTGLVNNALAKIGVGRLTVLYTETAIVLGLTQVFLGYMVLSLLMPILAIPDTLIAAAKGLGASSWRVFWHIILPLSRAGIFAGVSIVFPLSVSAYIIPQLLGGNRNLVMSTQVFQAAIVQLRFERAAAVSIVLFLIIVVVLVLMMALGAREHAQGRGVKRPNGRH